MPSSFHRLWLRRVACLVFILLLTITPAVSQIESQLVRRQLEQAVFSSGAPGMSAAVSVDGRLVFSEGAGFANLELRVPATGATVYRIASISKPIAAIGVMQLIERGLVKLDDPIQKYVPSFPIKPQGTVNLMHVLTHTSGIRHYNPGEFGKIEHFGTLDEAIEIFKNDPLKFAPGTSFSYTTYGFNLLQGVIESVGGPPPRGGGAPQRIPLTDYMRRHVWAPAGMNSTFLEFPQELVMNRARGYTRQENGPIQNAPYDDVSIKFVGGGMISTVEDLVRVFIALDAGRLLKAETLKQMYAIHYAQGDSRGRGLGWAIDTDERGRRRISHSGGSTGFNSMLINYPEQRLVVAAITICDYYGPGRLAQELANIYLAALDAGKK